MKYLFVAVWVALLATCVFSAALEPEEDGLTEQAPDREIEERELIDGNENDEELSEAEFDKRGDVLNEDKNQVTPSENNIEQRGIRFRYVKLPIPCRGKVYRSIYYRRVRRICPPRGGCYYVYRRYVRYSYPCYYRRIIQRG